MSDKLKTLSFSGYKRYTTCPKMDYMHTVEGIRPKYQHSPLVFGSACDAMLNALLDEKLGFHSDPLQAFHAEFMQYDLNNVIWDENDIDFDLIKPGQYDAALLELQSRGFKGDNLKQLSEDIFKKLSAADNLFEAWEALTDNQRHALTVLSLTTIFNKAEYILASYRRYIMPRIEKVEQVQKGWEIDGKIIGIEDYVAIVRNEGRILIDNKTCNKPYKEHAAKRDPQLLINAAALGIDKVGFIAILKHMKKNKEYKCEKCGNKDLTFRHKKCNKDKCDGKINVTMSPEAMIQFLIEPVSQEAKDLAKEALLETQKLREQGPWPRNLNACNWIYGKPCVYIEKCWGNSNKNLTKKEKE